MPPWSSRPRFALALLAGTAAALLVPLLVVVRELLSSPRLLADGAPDDGHTHMLVLLLMAWPVLYAAVAMVHAAIFFLLFRLGLLRWPVAAGLSAALSGGLSLAAGAGVMAALVLATSFAAGTLLAVKMAVPGARAVAQAPPPGS
ncbi:MAG: hypothetical protein V4679_18255 [Pseudomonadota bacterium]